MDMVILTAYGHSLIVLNAHLQSVWKDDPVILRGDTENCLFNVLKPWQF